MEAVFLKKDAFNKTSLANKWMSFSSSNSALVCCIFLCITEKLRKLHYFDLYDSSVLVMWYGMENGRVMRAKFDKSLNFRSFD